MEHEKVTCWQFVMIIGAVFAIFAAIFPNDTVTAVISIPLPTEGKAFESGSLGLSVFRTMGDWWIRFSSFTVEEHLRGDSWVVRERVWVNKDVSLVVYGEGDKSASPIVYFHGGGFVIGGADGMAGVLEDLAKSSGRDVISVEYRLAPEYPYPAAVVDAVAAVEFVVGEMGYGEVEVSESLRVVPILLAGDSAGGTLAVVVAMEATGYGYGVQGHTTLNLTAATIGRGSVRARVDGIIPIYPGVDFATHVNRSGRPMYNSAYLWSSTPPLSRALLVNFARTYLQNADPTLYTVSPLEAFVSPNVQNYDLVNGRTMARNVDTVLRPEAVFSSKRAAARFALPPALVIVAKRDVLHDEVLAFAGALKEAGVAVAMHMEDAPHGFITGRMIRFQKVQHTIQIITSWIAAL